MYKKQRALELLGRQKLLPLFYHDSIEVSSEILKALYAVGIRMVEYTARGKNALGNFYELKKYIHDAMPDLQLGIGTIKTAAQAEDFIKAGPDFIICPNLNVAVGEVAARAGLLWIPGCMTATEIACAEEAGATLIKIFPGNILGPSFIRAIKEIFPALRFIPTGGVEATEENLHEWFASGVTGVGMGSKLFTTEIMQKKLYKDLERSAARALFLVKKASDNAG